MGGGGVPARRDCGDLADLDGVRFLAQLARLVGLAEKGAPRRNGARLPAKPGTPCGRAEGFLSALCLHFHASCLSGLRHLLSRFVALPRRDVLVSSSP